MVIVQNLHTDNFYSIKLFLSYRYWWNTRIFPFTKKLYLHRAQRRYWRYYFYLSRVRILVSPWLLTWLANYKRASRSGARPVLLKFHSQNGFEVRRRYSYRWLSRWAAKFSHRYFFPAWRTFRKICRSLGKWCWKIHWKIKKSCLLCRNFISSCKINRTLYGRLGDTNFIFKQFGLVVWYSVMV